MSVPGDGNGRCRLHGGAGSNRTPLRDTGVVATYAERTCQRERIMFSRAIGLSESCV